MLLCSELQENPGFPDLLISSLIWLSVMQTRVKTTPLVMFSNISLQKSSGEWESIPVSAQPAGTHFLWDLQPSQNLLLDGPRGVTGLQNAQFKELSLERGQENAGRVESPGIRYPGISCHTALGVTEPGNGETGEPGALPVLGRALMSLVSLDGP